MKIKIFSASSIFIVIGLVFIILLSPQHVYAATATVTDIPDPDTYSCGLSGYINFELMSNETNLSSNAINGVQFTTTNGFTWLVGDFGTGYYNGKYPSGSYTSQGTHWAWLGESQGAGRIDFVNGTASIFSLLTSDYTPVYLDAYSVNDVLLSTVGPSSINTNTGHMDELKITRDTADIAYVIVHDSGNYFLVDSICTDAPGVPYQKVYDFKQNRNSDGTKLDWTYYHLFEKPPCPTMETDGCAITAISDVLLSYGLSKLPDDTPTNPGTLNHFLSQKNGTSSGCGVFWGPAIQLVNYSLLHIDFPKTTTLATRIQHIDEALSAGNLVIAGIGGHYVVFYQKTSDAPDGSPDYLIVDPYRYKPFASGDRSGTPLSQFYSTINQLQNTLQVVVIENKAPQPGRSWAIIAHSPVELLITDPTGAQTGFNPATSTYLQDIVGSTYGVQQGLIDDSGVLPPLPDTLYFGQSNLSDGKYTVQVIGTGSGSYSLDFGVANGHGDSSLQTVTGTTEPGHTDTYVVSVVENQPISIQLYIYLPLIFR
jgi:hypothetical protein